MGNHANTGAELRVRTPGHADVLCGRGGGINSHEGNIAFRELVKKEKERYNVAADKFEKADISHHVIDLVRNRGGRFLAKEDDDWWVEIDYNKAMAKTSQALREGAPSIRAKAARKKMKMKRRAARAHAHDAGANARELAGATRSTSSKITTYSSSHGRKVTRRQLTSDSSSKEEEEEHPLIRGYPNGRRGKILIPVAKKEVQEVQEQEHPFIRGSPNGHRGKIFVQQPAHSHPSTPPLPQPQDPTTFQKGMVMGMDHMTIAATGVNTTEVQVPRFSKQDEIATPKLLPTAITAQHMNSSFMPPMMPALPGDTGNDEAQSNAQAPIGSNGTGLYPCAFPLPGPMEMNLSPVKHSRHPAASTTSTTLSVMNPDHEDYNDIHNIVKPDMGCARMHSLAFSEMSCIEDSFHGDEAFSNPFENENMTMNDDENGILPGALGTSTTSTTSTLNRGNTNAVERANANANPHTDALPKNNHESNSSGSGTDVLRSFYPTPSVATSSDDLSIAKVNTVLKFRSSDSSFNSNGKRSISPSSPMAKKLKNSEDNANGNGNVGTNINPIHLKSLRSFMSELSDLKEMAAIDDDDYVYQDFHEGLRDIYDAVTPGLTTPEEGEAIPTHLTPYSILRSSSKNQ